MTEQNQHKPLHIVVILSSVRDGRIGHPISQWVTNWLHTSTPHRITLIDLAAVELPDDRLLTPGGITPPPPTSADLSDADAFIVVTPEYNHSIPAPLKCFMDWHYHEWQRKAALIVSYGALGGIVAAEQLRGIFAELSVVTTRRVIALARPWESLDDQGLTHDDGRDAALKAAFSDLEWWATALRSARSDSATAAAS